MNKDLRQYEQQLKKHLLCGHRIRRKLLDQFRDSLSGFLEDQPEPTYEHLLAAFGPPDEMAGILMEKVSTKEFKIHQSRKKIVNIFAISLAALFIWFSLYVFFEKEFAVVESFDEAYPIEATSFVEGEEK